MFAAVIDAHSEANTRDSHEKQQYDFYHGHAPSLGLQIRILPPFFWPPSATITWR